jgi:hypothetical protein
MVEKLRRNGIAIEWEEVVVKQPGSVICKSISCLRSGTKQESESMDWNEIASWFKPGGIAFIPYKGNPFTDA